MALQAAQHEAVHNKTGSDLARLKAKFDEGIHSALVIDHPDDNPVLTSILYQMQKMQDEIDYLRTEISANKDKTTFPGFGTSSTTALAGDTTTISTAQANAITANTAKASMVLGTTNKTALAGDTTTISTSQANEIAASTKLGLRLQASRQASFSKSTAIEFGEFTTTVSGKTTTYSIPITVTETTIGGKSNTTITKTGSITLT